MTINNLKVSRGLKALVLMTARRCRIPVSDVLRATARGILNGRPVIQFTIDNRITAAGREQLPIRGLSLPEGVEPAEFRRLLALRCMEELRKPRRAAAQNFPKLRRGLDGDYLLEEDLARLGVVLSDNGHPTLYLAAKEA